MRPVKPKNDDEDDCRRSWSKRSDTLVASIELSPLWLPGAQSLELSIESSYCMCGVHAKLRHVKTRMRASLEREEDREWLHFENRCQNTLSLCL